MTILELVKRGSAKDIDFDRFVSGFFKTLISKNNNFNQTNLNPIKYLMKEHYNEIKDKLFNLASESYQSNIKNGNILISVTNQSLINMLLDTDIDDNLDLTSIKYPFKSFFLCFPVIEADTKLLNEIFFDIDNKIKINLFTSFDESGPSTYKAISDNFLLGTFTFSTIEELKNNVLQNISTDDKEKLGKATPLFNKALPMHYYTLSAKLLFFLSTHKASEVIERERKTILDNGKKYQSQKVKKIYPVNLFSNTSYRYKGDFDNIGSKKSAHLVRGHFRNQPFGESRSQSRIIWIEPFFKGIGDDEIKEKIYKI